MAKNTPKTPKGSAPKHDGSPKVCQVGEGYSHDMHAGHEGMAKMHRAYTGKPSGLKQASFQHPKADNY